MTQTDKKFVYVAILTPYLSEVFGTTDNCKGCPDLENCAIKQQKRFGYDPSNFSGIDKFDTQNHIVLLEKPRNHKFSEKTSADFAIAGNTFKGEMEVRALSRSGLIVARYSTFYPNRSDYTDCLPGDAGYSLDIPKKVPVVKAFITNDQVLDALVSREEERIRSAVDDFNAGRDEPVLVTPFLREALKVKK